MHMILIPSNLTYKKSTLFYVISGSQSYANWSIFSPLLKHLVIGP